jgi:hypothetical protein
LSSSTHFRTIATLGCGLYKFVVFGVIEHTPAQPACATGGS